MSTPIALLDEEQATTAGLLRESHRPIRRQKSRDALSTHELRGRSRDGRNGWRRQVRAEITALKLVTV